MILSDTRFGELKYSESEVLHFEEGLLGFSQCQHFLLVPHSETSVFKWLQNIEDPLLAWPVVDPNIYISDYESSFKKRNGQKTIVLSIVNIPAGKPLEGTINLLAPIIIDIKKSEGKQIILEHTNYPLKYPLFIKEQEKNNVQDAA